MRKNNKIYCDRRRGDGLLRTTAATRLASRPLRRECAHENASSRRGGLINTALPCVIVTVTVTVVVVMVWYTAAVVFIKDGDRTCIKNRLKSHRNSDGR